MFGLKPFFNTKYAMLINELGVVNNVNYFSEKELIKYRDQGKDSYNGTAHEAVLRAFIDLVLKNDRIPIAERIRSGFQVIDKFKLWYYEGKINPDLYKTTKPVFRKIIANYTGPHYIDMFLDELEKAGVIIPIEHDFLDSIVLMAIVNSAQNEINAPEAGIRFLRDFIFKNYRDFPGSFTEEGIKAYEVLGRVGI